MQRLKQMSIFAHIVEQGSISAAAEKLELSKSVLSLQLKQLEAELGCTLLKRTTRRQTLTELGEQFYASCQAINQISEQAWTQMQQQHEPSGRIRITAPHALMEALVTPVIGELLARYPKLRPELIADDQPLNLIDRDIDLAIRVGASPNSNLKQKRIGQFRDVLAGTPALLGKSIETLPYISNAWQGRHYQHVLTSDSGEPRIFISEASCVTDSFHSALALIRSGVGIGLVPDFLLAQQSPALVSMTPNCTLKNNVVYALTPFAAHTPSAVKTCVEHLATRLSQQQKGK